jgi:hypothetical protein
MKRNAETLTCDMKLNAETLTCDMKFNAENLTCDMKHGVMVLPGSLIGRPPKTEEF